MRYKPQHFQIFQPLVSLVAVSLDTTRRAPSACNVLSKILGGKKKEIIIPFGGWCFHLFIESILIMGGTLGQCGSSSVENIDFFSTIAHLTKKPVKKSKLS